MGASSSFGNMFSVVGASAFLPYVPMSPIQILSNNLLYDFSQVPIPTDDVDPEQIARPRPWSMNEITRFILFIGPCSSIFDYTTYLVMLYVSRRGIPARATCFRPGGSSSRSSRKPSLSTSSAPTRSRSCKAGPVAAHRHHGSWSWLRPLPSFSPLASALGFVALPRLYWLFWLMTLACYMVLTQVVKAWLLKKAWA